MSSSEERMSLWQVIVLVVWGVLIAAGYYLGKRKRRKADGVWLAIILGPIGLAITAFALHTRPPEPRWYAVDLDEASNELRDVVHRSLEPAHISVWLTPPD